MSEAKTAIFLFSDHAIQACECGRKLGGSYVELENDPPDTARQHMFALRGGRWSHEVNGVVESLIGYEDPEQIRATHQRLPANPPGGDACFCGGLGQPYDWARGRGAP